MKFLLDSYIDKGFEELHKENADKEAPALIGFERYKLELVVAHKFYKQGFKDAIELLTQSGEADEKK